MSRPSHAMKQQVIDDAMASMPSTRWRWLFTPDPRWLAAVNTTTLREVNAVRMFVALTVLVWGMVAGVVTFALLRCGVLIALGGYKVLQILPPAGKLSVEEWRACEDSLATGKLLNFASEILSTYGWILAAMASVAIGAKWVNRSTDTEHNVEVLKAKAGIEQAKATAKPDQVNMAEAGGTIVAPVNGGSQAPPAPAAKAPGEPDNKTDDESGQ